MDEALQLPYWPTLLRLVLALAIGLFIGIERERRRKEAGLRTFAFSALVGAVGGLLGDAYALLALGLLGVLIVLLNVDTIHKGEGAEITTSAALLLTGFTGVLAGQGHIFTPSAVGIATAAFLSLKEPLAGFSRALTESEFRSAVLLAIIAFVIFPVLPTGTIDPWALIEPRRAWVTVVLIAALGFANYVLLKLYGARGIEFAGFLGGLVNSTVTTSEMAHRVRESNGAFASLALHGITLATAAMLTRNVAILGFLAPAVLVASAPSLGVMLAATLVFAFHHSRRSGPESTAADGRPHSPPTLPALKSPFSPTAALRFGLIFLALQVGGTLAQRSLGQFGFYAVSLLGGFISSASTVAAAANLGTTGELPVVVAGVGAFLASAASAAVNLPLVARIGRDPWLTRASARIFGLVGLLGLLGALAQLALS